MNNNQTILITGGCGFVGKHLINYLLTTKTYQTILVCCHHNVIDKTIFSKNKSITIVKADLLQPESYQAIIKNHQPDDIIHLAAFARYRQGEESPETTIKANFFGSIRLIELAKANGVKRFLYVSTNLARNPKGVTGISKFLFEARLKKTFPPPIVISTRLPNVIDSPGAVTHIFKKQIEENKPITLTDKRMTRKFITPEQAVIHLLFILKSGSNGDIYVNNKPSTPIIELAQQMIDKSGKNIPITFIGIRKGEKLQEEDYPNNAITPTLEKDIFLLTEDQHLPEDVKNAIELLKGKITEETMKMIKKSFLLK